MENQKWKIAAQRRHDCVNGVQLFVQKLESEGNKTFSIALDFNGMSQEDSNDFINYINDLSKQHIEENKEETETAPTCSMCGAEGTDDNLSWCKTCAGDICDACEYGHDTWGA